MPFFDEYSSWPFWPGETPWRPEFTPPPIWSAAPPVGMPALAWPQVWSGSQPWVRLLPADLYEGGEPDPVMPLPALPPEDGAPDEFDADPLPWVRLLPADLYEGEEPDALMPLSALPPEDGAPDGFEPVPLPAPPADQLPPSPDGPMFEGEDAPDEASSGTAPWSSLGGPVASATDHVGPTPPWRVASPQFGSGLPRTFAGPAWEHLSPAYRATPNPHLGTDLLGRPFGTGTIPPMAARSWGELASPAARLHTPRPRWWTDYVSRFAAPIALGRRSSPPSLGRARPNFAHPAADWDQSNLHFAADERKGSYKPGSQAGPANPKLNGPFANPVRPTPPRVEIAPRVPPIVAPPLGLGGALRGPRGTPAVNAARSNAAPPGPIERALVEATWRRNLRTLNELDPSGQLRSKELQYTKPAQTIEEAGALKDEVLRLRDLLEKRREYHGHHTAAEEFEPWFRGAAISKQERDQLMVIIPRAEHNVRPGVHTNSNETQRTWNKALKERLSKISHPCREKGFEAVLETMREYKVVP